MTVRLAMWSGPRNISTAMMRSWENRPDCSVVDEPFYACYLAETGLLHPCRDAILAAQSSDRGAVVRSLCEDRPGEPLFYQKQMTHHIPPGMDMAWCAGMRHCFLIRNPAEVITSYLQKMPTVDADAIGIVRQAALFDEIAEICGERPAVIDSNDVLANPGGVLEQLCAELALEYLPGPMLKWPAGSRDSDGVWASHWYQSVEKSTGFGQSREQAPTLASEHRELAETMDGYYRQLAKHRLRGE